MTTSDVSNTIHITAIRLKRNFKQQVLGDLFLSDVVKSKKRGFFYHYYSNAYDVSKNHMLDPYSSSEMIMIA